MRRWFLLNWFWLQRIQGWVALPHQPQRKAFRPSVLLVAGLGCFLVMAIETAPGWTQLPSPTPPVPQNPPIPASSSPDSSSSSPALSVSNTLLNSFWRVPNPTASLATEWIRLDGTRIFQIAGLSNNLPERQQQVQANLQRIAQAYFRDRDADLQVQIQESEGQPVLRVNDSYLLTVTAYDAQLRGIEQQDWATELQTILERSLVQAKQARQRPALIEQGKKAAVLFVTILIGSFVLENYKQQLQRRPVSLGDPEQPLSLLQRWRLNQGRLRTLKQQLIQTSQTALWIGGWLYGLSLFPYTRPMAVWLAVSLRIPLVISAVLAGVYILVRLSHLLVDRFSLALSSNPLLARGPLERAHQRINTIARVIKGLTVLLIASTGIIITLLILGIDIGPLLAGAGLLGVAISLASQNVIKDAINGFLIVLEDQYGVGDIVQIGEWTGLVEDLNLRITQLRNSEGKLISIPNSEVKIVANLSSNWARVDLNIPVPYEVNLEKALDLIQTTAIALSQEEPWSNLILEEPQLMGVEDFSERGLVIKLWIKTQPLKQWEVAREYRRRLKRSFDEAGIEIPAQQRSLWYHMPPLEEIQVLNAKTDAGQT